MTGGIVVILEGPDGSGKTHAADALANFFGADRCFHEGPEPKLVGGEGEGTLSDRYFRQARIVAERAREDGIAIMDRFVISEGVYADAFDRLDRLGPALSARCLAALRLHGVRPFYVLCLPARATCEKGILERGDSLVDRRILAAAWSHYACLARTKTRWNHLYDRDGRDALPNLIDAVDFFYHEHLKGEACEYSTDRR